MPTLVSSCCLWGGLPVYLAHTGTAAGGLSGRYQRHTSLFVPCEVVSRLLLKPCLHRRQGTLCRPGLEEGHVALIVAGSLVLAEDARWGSMVPQTSAHTGSATVSATHGSLWTFQPCVCLFSVWACCLRMMMCTEFVSVEISFIYKHNLSQYQWEH